MEMDDLKEIDRVNIAALMADPKMESMLKIHRNVKSRYLKTVAFKKDPDREEVYRGGAMAITSIITGLKGELETKSAQTREAIEREKGLNMVGW